MKKHLERQLGVQNVDVNLLDGKVEIKPKEDGLVDPAELLKATFDSGVTVAELDVVARGVVVDDGSGGLALRIGPNRSFPIAPSEAANALKPSGAAVTVRGPLYRKPAGKPKAGGSPALSLSIVEIVKKE